LKSIQKVIGAAFGAVSIAALTKFGTKLTKVLSDVAKFQDQIAKTSKAIGISTTALSGLAFAADRSGASLESVVTGLRTISRRASDASNGLKTAERSFEMLNIQVEDSEGNLKTAEDLLIEVADRFAKMTDATRKAALAQELFGRGGIELIPLLNEGARGIKNLQKRADELGITFNEIAAKQGEDFVDAMRDIEGAFEGLKNLLAIDLLPSMTSFVNSLTDVIMISKELSTDPIFKPFIEAAKLNIKKPFIDFAAVVTIAKFKLGLLDDELKDFNEDTGKEVTPIELPALVISGRSLEKQIEDFEAEQKVLEMREESARITAERMQGQFEDDSEKRIEALKKRGEKEAELRRKADQDEINSNKQKAEIEKQLARDRIAAAEGFWNDLTSLQSSKMEELFIVGKAAAIAETIINTIKSAQAAFSALVGLGPAGPFLAAGAAAAATVAGFARVEQIRQTEFQRRQFGGPVSQGEPTIVGEGGREMFVPQEAGIILNNRLLKQLGQGGGNITINAIDAQSFQQFMRRSGNSVLQDEKRLGKLAV